MPVLSKSPPLCWHPRVERQVLFLHRDLLAAPAAYQIPPEQTGPEVGALANRLLSPPQAEDIAAEGSG